MKKKLLLSIGLVVVLVVFGGGIGFYFFKTKIDKVGSVFPNTKNLSTWEFIPTITEPIIATSNSDGDITLGDMSVNKVSVVVSKGAFDKDTQVELKSPDSVPGVDLDVVQTIGAPIELSAGGPVRLNEKATVTFAFDPEELSEGTKAYQMRVAYFSGQKWDYIKPTSVDLEAGKISFETYHFSLLGANRISDDTKIIEQWTHSAALDEKLKSDVNDLSDEVAGKVIDLMLQKMGINDKSIKGQVLSEVLKNDSYKELYDLYQNGDVMGFSQKVALVAGSKIASSVPESAMQEALSQISGDASEDVAKVAEAAGYMAEGQYKEAAKIIGEQIADKFLITTAGKIAVEVVDYQIESWKNSEIEAAYQAYRDGADSYFYGYNNDPGDFDTVWYQMRGIRRQLELEAVKKENEVRSDAGMPELTDRQIDLIRDSVKRTFRAQFEKRQQHEEELKKAEERLNKIMKAFAEADFFDSLAPAGIDKYDDLETKLDLLNTFVKKILRDTNRKDVTEIVGYLGKDKIQLDEMVIAAKFYFSEPDGRQKYAEYLQEHFGVSLYPNVSELSGSWSGSMTINDVSYPPEWTESKEIASTELGEIANEACEGVSLGTIAGALEEMKGKKTPVTISISPSSDSGGTLTFSANGEGKEMPFSYHTGSLKATFTQGEAVVTITLMPTKNEESITASGTINFNTKDIIKLNGSINITKQS